FDPAPSSQPGPLDRLDHDEPDLLDGPDLVDEPYPDLEPDQGRRVVFPDPTGSAAFTRAGLAARLADLTDRAHTRARARGRPAGPGPRTLYVHLTDHTLATGEGVLRVENLGPMLAGQLGELLGHNKIVVKPVIDLNDRISVDAYEIPDRIRERVRLANPVTVFPWSNTATTSGTDLDHVVPYADTGPPGQTSTDNLGPLTRLHHRAKTHGGWDYQLLPDGAYHWTSPHGARYRVDHDGTTRIDQNRTTCIDDNNPAA
ncbi:MAG: HNH endonuclease signature motif containing protein, partial [Nocardioidaceae bacterium]